MATRVRSRCADLHGIGIMDAISAEAELWLLSLLAFIRPSAVSGSSVGQSPLPMPSWLSRASLAGAMRHILQLSYGPLVATLSMPSTVRCGAALREAVAPVGLRPCGSVASGQGSSATALTHPSRPGPCALSRGLLQSRPPSFRSTASGPPSFVRHLSPPSVACGVIVVAHAVPYDAVQID